MDNLVTMIVDILRRKEEDAALNKGGPLAAPREADPRAFSTAAMAPAPARPAPMAPAGAGPRGKEPLHGGKTIDQILTEQGG